jgi:CHAT domain-containing protein/tetratricopeptide (TPR) repeat protein
VNHNWWTLPVGLTLILACGPGAQPPGDGRADSSVTAVAPLPDSSLSSTPIDSLLALGEQAYLQGSYGSARTVWDQALARSRAQPDSVAEARALTWLGLAAWKQGDYAAARSLGERALALKRRWSLESDLFKSYNALGLLAWNEGRLSDAMKLFGLASAAAHATKDLKGTASASGNLALVQTELGEFEEARRGFDSMRVAGRALGDGRIEGNALTNLGMLAVRVGDPGPAIELLEAARARYRSIGYPAGEQNALGQLGTAYAALGRPHQALAALDSALDLSQRQGLRQDEASNLEAMAELYRDAGDAPRALHLYTRSAPINLQLGLVVEAGSDLRSQAEIYGQLGALGAAQARADSALAVHRAAGARYEELTDLLLLAELASRAGEPDGLGRHIRAAQALARRLNTRRARAQVALVESRLADRRVDPAAALRVLHRARRDLADAGYGMEQEALTLEARALARLGRLDSAAAVGRRALVALERVRGNLQSGALRTSYLTGRQDAYLDLALVLRRLRRDEQAFEVVDAARGRALVEGMGGSSPGSLRRGDLLLRRIDALTGQLRDAEADDSDASDAAAAAKVRFLRERLTESRREYEELAIRLGELRSPGTTLLGAGWMRTATILAGLASDEALLEYQPTADSLLIFVARRRGLTILAVPLPPGGLQPKVRLARELIAQRSPAADRALPVLRSLDELLVRPARRSGILAGVRQLVIVPHGLLAYLPFAALQNSETARFLVQDFMLLTLPSASALVALRERRNSPDAGATAAVLAPASSALPATNREAGAVVRSLPRAELLSGEKATEPRLRAALGASGLVHLATHAELNSLNPMFSWLQMATGRGGDTADDGRLEVHEILGLRVRSPLVFLSGCETGLGMGGSTAFTPGEDFATLARAFLYAGAGSVVATLWRVDDEAAAALAERFYSRVDDKPSMALAMAQRELLSDRRYRSPFYWAGYTLAGDGGAGSVAKGTRVSVK